MEENKSQEKHEGHSDRKCHGLNCHCGSLGHKVAKIALAVIIVIILLSIGAALGARRSARFYNFDQQNGIGFGCRAQNDWRDGDRLDERRFQMMRGNQNFQNQGNQILEGSAPVGTQPAGNPAIPTGTSTPGTTY
jgi:hypothetical protein